MVGFSAVLRLGDRLHCQVAGLHVLTRGIQTRGLIGQAGCGWVGGQEEGLGLAWLR